MIPEFHNQRGHKRGYDLEELRKVQEKIAARVIVEDLFKDPIQAVTGFDIAYLNDEAVAAAVTMDYETLQVVEEKTLVEHVSFPYIPSLLGFREGPLIIKLADRLRLEPDILMVNAQGIAHPFFCGCASHIGVLINKPTIGVARTRLCGDYEREPETVGEWVPLTYDARTVGAVLLSKRGCRPIFVSVGHMITLESAVKIVKHFLTVHKFPEPLRLSHVLANRVKRNSKLSCDSDRLC
ncbi:MAG: endonuclease V [Candidatus Bathyarchaeia archaeon]